MPTKLLINWAGSPTDMTVTNLASLGDGNFWQSGEFNDATPSDFYLKISYEIDTSGPPPADQPVIAFSVVEGDMAASNEIWEGGLGTSEAAITAAAAKAEIESCYTVHHGHYHSGETGPVAKGIFTVHVHSPSWQLVIKNDWGSSLDASGHRVRYQYGTPEFA